MNKSQRVFGEPEVIDRAERATVGDKAVYINLEAIRMLPDQYEAVISEIRFDPKNLKETFSEVGNGNLMPKPEIMYRIAEARGIIGGAGSIVDPVYENVNVAEMLMEETPRFILMKVGYKCTKYSEVMQEDGTMIRSSQCTVIYNAYDRASDSWAREEKYTEGYTKKSQYPNKYQTKFDRKVHFNDELKFSLAKAETKAHLKTIRELAGLQTGYKEKDLSEGRLIFAKIRRSREILTLESAARLSAISQGFTPEKTKLFDTVPAIEEIKQAPTPEPKPTRDNGAYMLSLFNQYEGILKPEHKDSAANVMNWLKKEGVDHEHHDAWPQAINFLKEVEKTLPSEVKITHDLY